MWKRFFIFWIFLLPFAAWRGVYEGTKAVFFLSGGFFLAVRWIIKIIKSGIRLVTSDYLYLGWLFILLISSLLGVHPVESILGGSYRHQGFLFFLTLWLVGITVASLSKNLSNQLSKGIAIGVLAQSFIVIFQKLFGPALNGRPLGTFGEPNAIAGFLVVGSVFFLQWKKKFIRPFLLLVLLAVLLTSSRTGIFSFFVLVYGLVLGKSLLRKSLFVIGVLLFALVFVVFVGFATRPEGEFVNRRILWEFAIAMIRERPLLGLGPESGEAAYDIAFKEADVPLFDLAVDRAHNLFLDIAIWSGIFGLSFFSLWLVSEARSILLVKSFWKVSGLLAWLTFSLFQPLGVVHWMLLFVILRI